MDISFKQTIELSIDKHGYHVTVVGAGIVPRFAYSIGLYRLFEFELVFPGGIWYMKDQVLQIFYTIFDSLKLDKNTLSKSIAVKDLGNFSFLPVDQSWSKLMTLGVFDFYQQPNVQVYQILPDSEHSTLDIPDMSKEWSVSTSPVWRWLNDKWTYNVPEASTVATNLSALQGEQITELMRWEEDEWEMFAGSGPDVRQEDARIIPLATILGIDNTLLPALDLKIGKGLWRTDGDSAWQS